MKRDFEVLVAVGGFAVTSLIFIVLVFAFPHESKPTDNGRKEWPQRCLMCGREYIVTPVKNPNEVIPPTVEWCFDDGQICSVGFEMIMDQAEFGPSQERERQWLNHCLECQGCRCAGFKPDQWKKVVESIERVRHEQNQER